MTRFVVFILQYSYEMNLWVEAVLKVVPHLASRDRRQSAGEMSQDAHSSAASAVSMCENTSQERDEWSDWDSDEQDFDGESSDNFHFPSPPPPLPPVPNFRFPPVC